MLDRIGSDAPDNGSCCDDDTAAGLSLVARLAPLAPQLPDDFDRSCLMRDIALEGAFYKHLLCVWSRPIIHRQLWDSERTSLLKLETLPEVQNGYIGSSSSCIALSSTRLGAFDRTFAFNPVTASSQVYVATFA